MAFALRELYERCKESRRMETAAYASDEFGGLGGAISRKAEATLRELGGPETDKALERVFARLVRVTGDGEATRRREPLSAWAQDAEAQQVIEAFQKARLLVSDREPGGTRWWKWRTRRCCANGLNCANGLTTAKMGFN